MMGLRTSPKYPVVVPGVGPCPAPGMIIGEAPGRTEIEQGTPFCGRSGALLDESLGLAGGSRGSFYITNVFQGDVGTGNRNPTPAELKDHWEVVRGEIARVAPRGILLLGRVATYAFLPEIRRMGDVVGTRCVYDGISVYPCWHPAYVLRNREALTDFQATVMKFVLVTEVLDAHTVRD